MFLLIEAASQTVLCAGERIARIGTVDRRALDALDIEYDYIDARKCTLWPGLIDVHEHLIGGSGEDGWGSQSPEITLEEIVGGGITTVVGCLGTDTITRSMPALYARAKSLDAQGITAWIWSGGYDVPPATLTGSVRRDMLLIDLVIGAGEIAIADHRSTAPSMQELARIVRDAHVGGVLTGKAGVTHFHLGDEQRRLADLRGLLDEYGIEPDWVYPTHVERSEALLNEAADLTKRGVTVDIDVVEEDLAKQLRVFLDAGGDPAYLTASSDAAITSPMTLFTQVRDCIVNAGLPQDLMMATVTSNPARILKLGAKGCVETGADADFTLIANDGFELQHVIARGKRVVLDGSVVVQEAFAEQSNRKIEIRGGKV